MKEESGYVGGESCVCVHCGSPTRSLYRVFRSDAHIRLTRCECCHSGVVDPYVEYDNVLHLLDLVLHRPPVYRHLLFNAPSLPSSPSPLASPWALAKTGLLLLACDAFVAVSRCQSHFASRHQAPIVGARCDLSRLFPVVVAENAVFGSGVILGVILLTRGGRRRDEFAGWPGLQRMVGYLLRALIVSSVAKTLVLLAMIWEYDAYFLGVFPNSLGISLFRLVHIIVLTSNIVGISVVAAYVSSPAQKRPHILIASAVLAGLGLKAIFQTALLSYSITDTLFIL